MEAKEEPSCTFLILGLFITSIILFCTHKDRAMRSAYLVWIIWFTQLIAFLVALCILAQTKDISTVTIKKHTAQQCSWEKYS